MKELTTLAIILSVIACRGLESKETRNSKDAVYVVKPVDSLGLERDNKESTYIVKEAILDSLLSFPSMGEDIRQVHLTSFDLIKTPETNIHDPGVIDTIYQFKNQSADFFIYKAADKYILYGFKVDGKDFTFRNGLKLGVSQSQLLETFKLEAQKSDTISLGDLEQHSVVNFIFKDDKLIRIEYDGYFD